MSDTVIIIGAGASGLMAGLELAKAGKRVEIIEARNRPGGRMHTLHNSSFGIAVETGAEFIHGNLPHTLRLLKEFGIKYHAIKGQIWQVQHGEFKKEDDFIEDDHLLLEKSLKELEEDMTVEDFLNKYLPGERYNELKNSVRNYVQGYDAADISRASALALKADWLGDDEDQYRIEGGYGELTESLVEACVKAGCRIHYSSIIVKIEWEMNWVVAISEKRKRFKADKAIITISLPLLSEAVKMKGCISFVPEINEKRKAAAHLGYGNAIKFILRFKEPFWHSEEITKVAGRSLKNFGFLFSNATIPAWWTQLPDESPVLTGWLGGPAADKYAKTERNELLTTAIKSLAYIFRMSEEVLAKMLTAFYISNWEGDPFSRGAYSYAVVNGTLWKRELNNPEENTLYFAGEALGSDANAGTVEAALASGFETAEKIIKDTIIKVHETERIQNDS